MASHPNQTAASSTQLPDAATSCEPQELSKASYTPIPNVLLDEVMPRLLGSEWQLLCVVIRQTQGWHDPQTGGRKESDWLSHRQLKARTGRGSDAVCHAVESLVRQGYIEVKDEQGHLLATAHERRRNGNRLFYGLAETLRVHFGAQPAREESGASSSRQSRIGKTETTKETGTNISLQPFGKTEVRASRSRVSRFKSAQSGSGCGCALLDKKEQSIESPSHETIETPPLSAEVQQVIDAHRVLAQSHGALTEIGSALLGQDYMHQLETALARYGKDRLMLLLSLFFENNSGIMRRRDASLHTFIDSIHILAALRPQES